jgi:uncharacterized membrane protein
MGQIVGSYRDTAGNDHGFLLDQGRYTTFDVPGSQFTSATGINASGQIVGLYSDFDGLQAFLLDKGRYSRLHPSGLTQSVANGINAAGQIVGSYTDARVTHGFLATPVP